MEWRVNQRILFNLKWVNHLTKKSMLANAKIKTLEEVWKELSVIKWIWANTIKMLADEWIKTTEQLKVMSDAWIKEKVKNPISYNAIMRFINNTEEVWVLEQ